MPTLTLGSDDLEVVVLPEAGARLHSLRAFGELLTHTPPDPATHHLNPFSWGGYHLIPWCNRIEPGPYPVLGQQVTVPANFADGSAIHGLHYDAPWEHGGNGAFHTVGGGLGTGWPWTYTAAVDFSVDGPALTISYRLTNTSDRTMPGGLGFHPWFHPPSTIHIPSALVFPDNTDPAVRPQPVQGTLDLREPAPLDVGIDATWVELREPAVTLAWHELGMTLTIAADDPNALAVAARPPDVGAVAVELQTHAPAGVRRLLAAEPYALHALGPGDTLALALTFTVAR